MKIVWTRYALERLAQRKILESDVIEAVLRPELVFKKSEKYFHQKKLSKGTIEVCCEKIEKKIKVITAYWV